MLGRMPTTPTSDTDPAALADRLLDAQVAWVVEQLTGDALADLLAADVAEALRIGERLTLAQLVDTEALRRVVQRWARSTSGAALLVSLVDTVADAVYGLPAAAEHELGSVVQRRHVDALVVKLLSMHRAQDRLMSQLQRSPAVGQVATQYVTRLVSDVVQQNRERMEKVPGAKSLMSIGFGAASRVQKAASDSFLGDAAGKSAQFAIKRTNSAARDLIREAPLREAAMEVWDLQAAEPVAALREYVTAADVRELAQLVREIVEDARSSDYALALLDGVVAAIFEAYGDTDVTALLSDLGLGQEELLTALRELAPPLLTALHEAGELEPLVRVRLAPFFDAPSTQALLAGG